MSANTPRTDAAAYEDPTPGCEVVRADFARALERQLNDNLSKKAKEIIATLQPYIKP